MVSAQVGATWGERSGAVRMNGRDLYQRKWYTYLLGGVAAMLETAESGGCGGPGPPVGSIRNMDSSREAARHAERMRCAALRVGSVSCGGEVYQLYSRRHVMFRSVSGRASTNASTQNCDSLSYTPVLALKMAPKYYLAHHSFITTTLHTLYNSQGGGRISSGSTCLKSLGNAFLMYG